MCHTLDDATTVAMYVDIRHAGDNDVTTVTYNWRKSREFLALRRRSHCRLSRGREARAHPGAAVPNPAVAPAMPRDRHRVVPARRPCDRDLGLLVPTPALATRDRTGRRTSERATARGPLRAGAGDLRLLVVP